MRKKELKKKLAEKEAKIELLLENIDMLKHLSATCYTCNHPGSEHCILCYEYSEWERGDNFG